MANRLAGITIDCQDPARLASFWKVRIHLDIQVDDIDAARTQVEGLGGRWSGRRQDYPEGVVMAMHDPEGNEFCLVRYDD
jgi:predicted enzyme related to lactoylglutathione lyase